MSLPNSGGMGPAVKNSRDMHFDGVSKRNTRTVETSVDAYALASTKLLYGTNVLESGGLVSFVPLSYSVPSVRWRNETGDANV